MSVLSRRTATLLAVLTCALPAGSAQAAGTENVASATVTQDDARVSDFAWDISRERNIDVVDHANRALATASCLRCDATAIAFQIVLVSGSPTRVTPVNEAVALNVECTDCEAVAQARQFVRVVDRPVRFTGAGRAVLAGVRERLEALAAQDLPLDQLHVAVEAEEAKVRQVLADELVLRSDPTAEADAFEQRMLQAADIG